MLISTNAKDTAADANARDAGDNSNVNENTDAANSNWNAYTNAAFANGYADANIDDADTGDADVCTNVIEVTLLLLCPLVLFYLPVLLLILSDICANAVANAITRLPSVGSVVTLINAVSSD